MHAPCLRMGQSRRWLNVRAPTGSANVSAGETAR